jgi:hypothetical protein
LIAIISNLSLTAQKFVIARHGGKQIKNSWIDHPSAISGNDQESPTLQNYAHITTQQPLLNNRYSTTATQQPLLNNPSVTRLEEGI